MNLNMSCGTPAPRVRNVLDQVKISEATTVIRPRGRPKKNQTAATDVQSASSPLINDSQSLTEMLNVGENGPFVCCICQPQKPFKNSTGLRNHIGWKHSVTSKPAQREAKDGYKCDVCGMSIRGYGALTIHKWKKHGIEQLHKCDRCNETFAKLRSLHKHMAQEHGIQMFKCDICSAEFKSREGWRMHTTKMHLTAEELPSQVCYICGKAFRMPYQLKNHIKLTHKTVRDFACHLCTRAFKSCQSLKRHLLTYHNDDRSFSCDVCESKFKTRNDLSSHRKLHFRAVNPLPATGRAGFRRTLENGSYVCRYCSKTFSKDCPMLEKVRCAHSIVQEHGPSRSLVLLNQKLLRCKAHEKLIHEYKEAGVRFVCLPCDKAFPNQYYLIHHINNKHRQRNHRCPRCERLYSQAYLLRRHLTRCTGTLPAKPYSCDNCSLRFATKNNLVKHMNFPNRCHRNEVVECVILVDDGTGSLSFEGGKMHEKLGDYVIEQDATKAGGDFPLTTESLVHKVVDYSCMEAFENGGFDVLKEEQVVTMEETSIQAPACLVAEDMIEIEPNSKNQLLQHDYEEIQNSEQIVFDTVHNEVVQ